MKKILVTVILSFVLIAFVSNKSFSQSQTQEPVKTEQVKTHCGGHNHDATKTEDAKPADATKGGCAKATSKCPSTCPHAKAAEEKKDEPANSNEKRTPVPQK